MKTRKLQGKEPGAIGGSVERMVLLRLSLTQKESEVLIGLLRCAANEPSDIDATEFLSLKDKTEVALAQQNVPAERPES